MVDRVELVLRHQPLEMRELQRDHAFRREQPGHAGDEVVEVRDLGQHVVADDQIGAPALGDQRIGQGDAEEVDLRRDAFVDRDAGDVGGRLDAEHGHAERQEMLQQIAVIARKLDHQAVRAEAEPVLDHLAIGLGVRDPARGVGREVGVLAEDLLRAHVLLQLDQKAGPAHQRVQGEVGLHRVELARRQKALAERRHAEVDEGTLEPAAAQPAPA